MDVAYVIAHVMVILAWNFQGFPVTNSVQNRGVQILVQSRQLVLELRNFWWMLYHDQFKWSSGDTTISAFLAIIKSEINQ